MEKNIHSAARSSNAFTRGGQEDVDPPVKRKRQRNRGTNRIKKFGKKLATKRPMQ